MQIVKLMKIYYDFCMVALRKQHKLWLQHITKVRLCDGASGIVFRSWKKKKEEFPNPLHIRPVLGFSIAGWVRWTVSAGCSDIVFRTSHLCVHGCCVFSTCPAEGVITQM